MKPVKTTTQIIHPTHAHLGKIQTSTMHTIDFRNPCEDEIDIEDIATALSRICRFGGLGNCFYSVAQHSVFVMQLMLQLGHGTKLNLEALLHDAPEAYLGDVVKPLKELIGAGYKTIEANFETVIGQKYSLNGSKEAKNAVKQADLLSLELEHQALILGEVAPLRIAMQTAGLSDLDTWAWPSNVAKKVFLEVFMMEYDLKLNPIQQD